MNARLAVPPLEFSQGAFRTASTFFVQQRSTPRFDPISQK